MGTTGRVEQDPLGAGGQEGPALGNDRPRFELEIAGAYNYNAEGFGPAVALLDSGLLPLEFLIEPDDIPLDGVMSASGFNPINSSSARAFSSAAPSGKSL